MVERRHEVERRRGGWVVRHSGSLWPTSIHRTRAEGEAAARQIERNQQVALWVGGPNGRILAREISKGEAALTGA